MRILKQARWRIWLIGGALVLLLSGSAIVLRLSVRSNRPQARGRGERTALKALREGRFDQACALFRGLDDHEWGADDCFELGRSLLKRDRIVLGWAALEAARRLDPKHTGALRALDELGARLAQATGRERDLLQEAVSRRELMCSIAGGQELGMFVLGLAGYASEAGREQDFIDRLTVLDRNLLRRVKTTADATKLLARLLLFTGRATEAGALLEPLAAASPPDREAAWLASRVALQLDDTENADAMLALAGDYGRGGSSGPEPAPFVGARRCGECHRRLYREQQSTSRHALTLRFGSGLKNVPLPETPIPDPIIPSITHRFSRPSDDRIELETHALDRVIKAVVAYAVGSGRHGMTMIARDEDRVDRELRISYFADGPAWGQTKGIDFAPRDAGDHLGMRLSPKALDHCLDCHATWFRSVVDLESRANAPAGRDHGIGCERCHGPGKNHVKAAETGFAEIAIALGSATPARERLNSCASCHAADGSVQPSDPEFTRAQGTTFLFSRCVTASSDRFDCTTCHDPHRLLDTSDAHYEARCLSCHGVRSRVARFREGEPPGEPRFDLARQSRRAGIALPANPQAGSGPGGGATALPHAPSCPVNATRKCITCHMPKVSDPSRHSRFTDHHIRVHRDAVSVSGALGRAGGEMR
jgi:hypothetical protein